MNAPTLRRFAPADAACTLTVTEYRDQQGDVWLWAECHRHDGERCHTYAPATSRDAVDRRWLEHAAERAGLCWACSQPTAGWPNATGCRRCWLMEHAARGIWPRDAAPFPGDDHR